MNDTGRRHRSKAVCRNLHLEAWEADGHYHRSVKDSGTRNLIASGEADDADGAKLAPSAAAGLLKETLTCHGENPED